MLFQILRALRLRLARAISDTYPVYVIFSDRTLHEMVERLPQTPEELLQIHGVGPEKLARYGELFLSEIRDYVRRHGPNSSGEGSADDLNQGKGQQSDNAKVVRERLLASIAETAADYREGQLQPPMSPERVDRWIRQFDNDVQIPMLEELDYVFKKTYFSRNHFESFFRELLHNENLTDPSPQGFWRKVHFITNQDGGDSQRELLELFDSTLQDEFGFGANSSGIGSDTFIYLDDGVFTGNRVLRDLKRWIQSTAAPANMNIHVVTIVSHTNAVWYVTTYKGGIRQAAVDVGKLISQFEMWSPPGSTYENLDGNENISEVLRPTSIPHSEDAQRYAAGIPGQGGRVPTMRNPGHKTKNEIFKSTEGRDLLEQEFLKKGISLYYQYRDAIGGTQRPLGHMSYPHLGFGSLAVTYRNCPNNAPLVLWVEKQDWFPLFPRR